MLERNSDISRIRVPYFSRKLLSPALDVDGRKCCQRLTPPTLASAGCCELDSVQTDAARCRLNSRRPTRRDSLVASGRATWIGHKFHGSVGEFRLRHQTVCQSLETADQFMRISNGAAFCCHIINLILPDHQPNPARSSN